MRTLEEALDQFAYHPATPDTAPMFAAVRDKVMAFTRDIWELIPGSPEKTLALRHLQSFQMFTNLAIAMTSPADLTNHAVARVLPAEEFETNPVAVLPRDAGPAPVPIDPPVGAFVTQLSLTEEQRESYTRGGQCTGPITIYDAEPNMQRAKCYFDLCVWTAGPFPGGVANLQDLQLRHDTSQDALT